LRNGTLYDGRWKLNLAPESLASLRASARSLSLRLVSFQVRTYVISPFSARREHFGIQPSAWLLGDGLHVAPTNAGAEGVAATANLTPSTNVQLSHNGRYFTSGKIVVDLSASATQNPTSGFPVVGRYGIGNNGTAFIVHQAFIVSNIDLTLSTKPGLEDRQRNAGAQRRHQRGRKPGGVRNPGRYRSYARRTLVPTA
jgi:hypothetical protein